MNKKNTVRSAALLMAMSLIFAGCGNSEEKETETSAPASSSQTETEEKAPEASGEEVAEEEKKEEKTYIYIGTKDTEFKQIEIPMEGELKAEKLIEAIAEETGWNLSLSDEVTSGKGGMTVSFSKDSAIIQGPPMEQKDEYHVFDFIGLIHEVLDSVQETLRQNFVGEGGDPELLDIYFNVEDEPIVIADMGKEIPIDEPYTDAIWH